MAQSKDKDVVVTRMGAAAGAGGTISTFNFVAGELVGGSPVKNAPYSAEAVTESTQTLADGNRIVNQSSATVYRDGEGRERREQTLPNIGPFAAQGEPAKTIFISDPVAGVNYSLDPNSKVAVKLPANGLMKPSGGGGIRVKLPPDLQPPPKDGQPVAGAVIVKRIEGAAGGIGTAGGFATGGANVMYFRQGSSDASAPTTEQLGSKVIEGISADGARTTLTIAAGQIGNDKPIEIVDEMWRSPELQVIVHSEHSDPRMGSTVYSLKNVSRAEPAPTLFQVPADYTVKDAQTFTKAVAAPQ